jgi:hypothetical protein
MLYKKIRIFDVEKPTGSKSKISAFFSRQKQPAFPSPKRRRKRTKKVGRADMKIRGKAEK